MPEPVADLLRCGAGQGERCCIYLTVGAEGPQCARPHEAVAETLRRRADAGLLTAQRQPTEPWPDCWLPAETWTPATEAGRRLVTSTPEPLRAAVARSVVAIEAEAEAVTVERVLRATEGIWRGVRYGSVATRDLHAAVRSLGHPDRPPKEGT